MTKTKKKPKKEVVSEKGKKPDPAPVPSPAVPQTETAETTGNTGATQRVAVEALRVKVDLLNKLMNLAGELVLARNQVK